MGTPEGMGIEIWAITASTAANIPIKIMDFVDIFLLISTTFLYAGNSLFEMSIQEVRLFVNQFLFLVNIFSM